MEIENQKFYLTKHGLGKLNKEYEDLKKIRMAKTKEEADDEGDEDSTDNEEEGEKKE